MLMSLIRAINSHSEVEERGIETKAGESMRQEHAIMRRDGITPDRKHAAAVLPSWVGWGGGARRQRVDTAGGPALTRTTVRDIHLFHSQPLSLCSLLMPLASHSPVFTLWLSVHRGARFVAMIRCHVTTNHSDQAVELHWTRRRWSSQAAHASSPPLAAIRYRIVYICLLCNISYIISLSSKRVYFSYPNLYSHVIHQRIVFSFFTLLKFIYLFCISCSDYDARVLTPVILVSAPAWRQGVGLSDDLYDSVTFYLRLLCVIFYIYRYSLPFEAAGPGIYCPPDCVSTITPRHEIFSGISRSYYSRTSACHSPSSAWSVGGRASRIAFRIFSSLGLRIQRDAVNYLVLSPQKPMIGSLDFFP